MLVLANIIIIIIILLILYFVVPLALDFLKSPQYNVSLKQAVFGFNIVVLYLLIKKKIAVPKTLIIILSQIYTSPSLMS